MLGRIIYRLIPVYSPIPTNDSNSLKYPQNPSYSAGTQLLGMTSSWGFSQKGDFFMSPSANLLKQGCDNMIQHSKSCIHCIWNCTISVQKYLTCLYKIIILRHIIHQGLWPYIARFFLNINLSEIPLTCMMSIHWCYNLWLDPMKTITNFCTLTVDFYINKVPQGRRWILITDWHPTWTRWT